VKGFVAVILTLIISITSTDVIQLIKLPKLAQHFLEHRENDGEISFFDFLAEHYIHPKTDNDSAQDMELPFKQVEYSACLIVLAIPHSHTVCLKPRTFRVDKHLSEKPEIPFDSEYTSGIWQPPKNA
jgi:hypothetical protein